MLGIFRRKKKVSHESAAGSLIAHCELEAARLETTFSTALKQYCDDGASRPPFLDILARPLVSSEEGRAQASTKTLFAAHCLAIVLAKELEAAYEPHVSTFYADYIDWKVAELIAAQEVGPENVGHAPNPYPSAGEHISYAPDTLVGGIPSQQLALVRRYRGLQTSSEVVSMICLVFHIVSPTAGIGMQVLKAVPASRDECARGQDLVGYRRAARREIDEWPHGLEIFDAGQVLAPLPSELQKILVAAVDDIHPFWQSFCETHKLA